MGTSLLIGSIVCFGLLLVLLATGMRVYACMLIAGLTGGHFLAGSLNMLPFIPFRSIESWALAACPLFVFTGAMFLHTGISEGLYRGASAFLGGMRGGLLHANIGACAIFAAITGSTTATAATITAVAWPELDKRGYAPEITTGSLASGSILGALIPPSTGFIIYGSMTGTSVGKLFFGGLIPGIILAVLFMTLIFVWVSLRPSSAPAGERVTLKGLLLATKDLTPIILISVVILGGIYLGVYTPVEAGAVGCAASIVLAAALRRLSFKALHESALSAVRTTTFVMIIIVGSSVLANTLAELLIPFRIAEWIASMAVPPVVVLLGICFMFLVLGCIIESIPVLIMTLPVVFPVALDLGFDLIWFGVILIILTQIAMITPPVGLSLYIIQGVRGKGSLWEVIKGCIPFIFVSLVLLAIVIAFPQLATWLPSQMITR